MTMLTLAALVYTHLYYTRALRDCLKVCFQLNMLFCPLAFIDVSSTSFSHSPTLWEGVIGVLTEAYTIPHTAERKIERLKVFTTEKLSLISLHHFTLSTSFLLTHSLTPSTIHFFLSYPFSINLSFSFLTVVIFLSSLYPFFLLFMFFSFYLSLSRWVIGFLTRPTQSLAQPGKSESTVPLFSSPYLHQSLLFSPAPIILVLPWHFPSLYM